METILNNPYRTVGLLVGATAKEQAKQINRLKKFIEVEQDPQDDYSFPTLGSLERTLESVEDSVSRLNLDHDKINAALFWFWNGKPLIDEAAFEALKGGDIEGAYQIWENLTTETKDDGKKVWKSISDKNYSAYHNSSVLSLVSGKGAFVSAVVANVKFIESDYFEKLVKDVVDETYRVSKKDIQLNFLKTVCETIDNKKLADLAKYIGEYNFAAKSDFQKICVHKPIEQIEQKIETSKNKRKSSKANAAKAGQELFITTANNLTQLKSIVGANDLKYSTIADKVANEILQCSIDFFNDNQEKNSNVDYAKTAMNLAKQAGTIAVGNLTKDRIKDNMNSLAEMIDKELLQAIELLKSVQDAYETNKAKITAEVLSMPLEYNQSINWSKVNYTIEKSLDWDKVVDLILKVIPRINVEKIKNTKKLSQINEYKTLADFVVSKLGFSQVNKVKYICYWKTENTVSNIKLTVKSLPVWAKWCLSIAMFLLIVGLIWGEDGLIVVFVLGGMFLIGWFQSNKRYK